MITIRDVVDELVKLQAKLRGVPSFQWGTVLAVEPLTVRTDVDPTPVAGVSTTVACAVGDRVRLERQGSKLTVVGIAGGGTPNTIVADGQRYTASGTVSHTPASFTSVNNIGRSLDNALSMPFTPPAGYVFALTSLELPNVAGTAGNVWHTRILGTKTDTVSVTYWASRDGDISAGEAVFAWQLVADN